MELNIKHEPAVDYELILPAITEVKTENNNPFGIKPCSVNLEKFDAEWKRKSSIFVSYLTCKYCRWILRSKEPLKAHEKTCQGKQKLMCEFCDKKFDSKKTFRVHANGKPVECQPCQVNFKCRTLWSKHKQEHHQQGFKCDRCSFVAKWKCKFDKHYSHHTKEFYCETCEGRFCGKYELKMHQMQRWHGVFKNIEISFDCNQCEKVYPTERGLRMHRLQRHRGESLECDLCGGKFSTKQTMKQHLQIHVELECKFCGKMLAERIMANHVNKEHVKSEQSFSCKDCGKRFLNKSHYITHINPKKQFACPSCQIVFKCRVLWQKHQEKRHAEGFSFKCDQCSYVGKAKNTLRQHLRFHTKNFSCDSCHKKFAIKSRLEDHQKNKRHGVFATVKVETLQCDKCEKAFRTKGSLSQHKRVSHEFRNFECDVCGKTLKKKQSLIGHFRTHKLEKCEICGLSLTQNEMQNHLFRRHNQGDSSCRCKHCGTLFIKQILASHLNAKQRKCVPCIIEFKCRGLLSQHKQKMHGKK